MASDDHPEEAPSGSGRRRRPQLLWLVVPYVLYLGALPLVNRVQPVVLGLPFLFVWLLGATLLTPVAVWLTWRGDHRR
ncbi:hypothetical protein SSPIM334S_08453 [Streptomyces spiroverticillatus]|uniref:DUF3311 domain-containing protein n=1 Tax=Streptomyces finlayi TaxID=67296 RepID=UPI001E316BDD|nr:DUF3311 domain-containing protein [Streptomyces finlayi]